MNNYPDVEIRFPVLGAKLKIDHGYSLYAAIKKHICDNHTDLLIEGNIPMATRIATIKGTNLFNGYIQLKSFSRLRIRCDIKYAYQLIQALDNQLLGLPGGSVFIESGSVQKMLPADTVQSGLVVINYAHKSGLNYQAALLEVSQKKFIDSCYRQLEKHQIKGKVEISQREGKPIINSVTVDKTERKQLYVGYGVSISGLTKEDSLKLQMEGIGGKRHFGCGWFDRASEPTTAGTTIIKKDMDVWED
jgi:CRISPR-associated protein Cas6